MKKNLNTQDMHELYLTLYGVKHSHSTRLLIMQFEFWKCKGLRYKIWWSALLITKMRGNITIFMTSVLYSMLS